VIAKKCQQKQPMHSPELLIQLHFLYNFGYANLMGGVVGLVIMGLVAVFEPETAFKSRPTVSVSFHTD
jgi:hypothetical protein